MRKLIKKILGNDTMDVFIVRTFVVLFVFGSMQIVNRVKW